MRLGLLRNFRLGLRLRGLGLRAGLGLFFFLRSLGLRLRFGSGLRFRSAGGSTRDLLLLFRIGLLGLRFGGLGLLLRRVLCPLVSRGLLGSFGAFSFFFEPSFFLRFTLTFTLPLFFFFLASSAGGEVSACGSGEESATAASKSVASLSAAGLGGAGGAAFRTPERGAAFARVCAPGSGCSAVKRE